MLDFNIACSCAGKSGRRKNNAGIDKEEEKKLAGPLAKKELPMEGCSRKNGEEGSRQKKIPDDRHHQSVLPKGRSFTASAGTKAAVLPGIE